MLLCRGKTCYFGRTEGISDYFQSIGYPIPLNTNPAEYLLDLVNADFEGGLAPNTSDMTAINNKTSTLDIRPAPSTFAMTMSTDKTSTLDSAMVIVPLLRGVFIKSYRDVLAYGIRYAMYTGLAIMMGTVWLRLKTEQAYIQPFINAIVSHHTYHRSWKPRVTDYKTFSVLRLRLHVIQGCSLRPCVSLSSRCVCWGPSEWSIWSNSIHGGQFYSGCRTCV